MLGKEVLTYLKSKIGEVVDIYQNNKKESIPGQLQKATKNLQQARSNSFKDRQLMQCAEAAKWAAGEENKIKQIIKTRKILNGMQQKEQKEGMFRKMRVYTNKGNSLSLTHVDIPDENKLW
eukprot:15146211-Ditylum_brightwellii.AAC.1